MDAQVESKLSKTEAAFFRKAFFQVPYFYHLPKIHKDIENPTRIGSMDSITSSYSLYRDHFLQLLAQALPSYIHDGTHLIELLRPYTWEPSYLWVFLDICPVYTSIALIVNSWPSSHGLFS